MMTWSGLSEGRTWPLELGIGLPDLPGHSACHIADIDGLLDLSEAFGQDLPHLEGDQVAQGILLVPETLADLPHDLSPDGHWCLGKSMSYAHPLVPGLGHGLNSLLVVVGVGKLDLCDFLRFNSKYLFVGRIDAVLDRARAHPLAVDQSAVVLGTQAQLLQEGVAVEGQFFGHMMWNYISNPWDTFKLRIVVTSKDASR